MVALIYLGHVLPVGGRFCPGRGGVSFYPGGRKGFRPKGGLCPEGRGYVRTSVRPPGSTQTSRQSSSAHSVTTPRRRRRPVEMLFILSTSNRPLCPWEPWAGVGPRATDRPRASQAGSISGPQSQSPAQLFHAVCYRYALPGPGYLHGRCVYTRRNWQRDRPQKRLCCLQSRTWVAIISTTPTGLRLTALQVASW